MEESLNKTYVNVSNRKFEHRVYNDYDENIWSYKPSSGFWVSLESKDPEYYSDWEREYRGTFLPDENGNVHINYVKMKPSTYIFSPERDKDILEEYMQGIKDKTLLIDQKRKALVDLISKRKGLKNIEHAICQIDTIEDLMILEKVFGNFVIGGKYPQTVYDNLGLNVKKGIRESFSGLEVTAYALGMDEVCPGEGIQDVQMEWSVRDPKYDETIDYFDIPSAVFFDTRCLEYVKEIVYPTDSEDIIEKEENEREVDELVR